MKTAVQQWGNSLALRIPKVLAEQTRVKKGTRVSLTIEKGRMIVTPVRDDELSLKKLLSQVTSRNIHPQTDWGPPTGKETG
jgi:antitoxin MazE